jgi:hypothetical protein
MGGGFGATPNVGSRQWAGFDASPDTLAIISGRNGKLYSDLASLTGS